MLKASQLKALRFLRNCLLPRMLSSAVLIATSCSPLPVDENKSKSVALKSPPTTGVSGVFERAAKGHPGKSGFAVIPGNREAFTNRIALADFAQKTIDVQYFIWSADTTGHMMADALIKAAERGVRVRFLLDDINFKKRDSAAAALSAHPMIEVRIFNPHKRRSIRTLELALNFGRLNKRMHNKTMIMDNSVTIIGGRNIADEYFGLGEKQNNRDFDIAATGPIVRDISDTFDEFWNSPAAIPISSLVKRTYDINDFKRQLATMRSQIAPSRYPFPLEEDLKNLRSRINNVSKGLHWARGEVIHDSFESMRKRKLDETVVGKLRKQFQSAQNEILIESAYFVMRDSGIDFGRSLVDRGVKLRVLTNSLASNNVIAAQAGHSKRRKPLVDSGIDLYELRPNASSVMKNVASQGKNSVATLHSKALVIDGQKAFVGSYNLDPRSAEINSEIGLMVYNQAFAEEVKAFLNEGISPENAYHVTRNTKGKLQWQTIVDGQSRVWTKDPETSALQRFKSKVISWLPIEGQL